MKIQDALPNHLYEFCILSIGQDPLINALIHTLSKEQNTLFYEVIAADRKGIIIISVDEEIKPVPFDDLPLYIHYPYKTVNFENLLKGIPRTKTVPWHTINISDNVKSFTTIPPPMP